MINNAPSHLLATALVAAAIILVIFLVSRRNAIVRRVEFDESARKGKQTLEAAVIAAQESKAGQYVSGALSVTFYLVKHIAQALTYEKDVASVEKTVSKALASLKEEVERKLTADELDKEAAKRIAKREELEHGRSRFIATLDEYHESHRALSVEERNANIEAHKAAYNEAFANIDTDLALIAKEKAALANSN